MMGQLTFVFVGACGALATVGAVVRVDPLTRILSAGLGAVAWFIWAANAAAGVQLKSGAATSPLPGLSLLGYLLGSLMIGVAIVHVLRTLRDDETTIEDELDLGGLR